MIEPWIGGLLSKLPPVQQVKHPADALQASVRHFEETKARLGQETAERVEKAFESVKQVAPIDTSPIRDPVTDMLNRLRQSARE